MSLHCRRIMSLFRYFTQCNSLSPDRSIKSFSGDNKVQDYYVMCVKLNLGFDAHHLDCQVLIKRTTLEGFFLILTKL